jgi:hypothetical protein
MEPEVFCLPALITTPPLFHNHLSPPHEVRDSPDQAAHYHTLGPKLGASSMSRGLADLEVRAVYIILLSNIHYRQSTLNILN